MHYPRLRFNKHQIFENTKTIVTKAAAHGVGITAITKCTGGNPEVAELFLSGGARALGDSRLKNLKDLQDFDCEKWLIRLPALSEIEDTVRYATLSLVSELKTIKALNDTAEMLGKTHDILLMVDVGDLREGYFDIAPLKQDLKTIMQFKNIRFRGLGANSNCIGATIPEPHTFDKMFEIQHHIQTAYGVPCELISGGNSGTWYMVEDGTLPAGVNNIRLGEMLLFGSETSYGQAYDWLHHDNFLLDAEIIELKEKPSFPIGRHGVDAFGKEPYFEDRGRRLRAILALGKQDTSFEDLTPLDAQIGMIGASSDHLVIDITECDHPYHVGDIVTFRCNYVSALHASTSEYIDKQAF